jgi:hypothetical protein
MKYDFWDDFIVEGTEDYVGLWEIIHEFRAKYPETNQKQIQKMTLEAVREILDTGFMQIGMFDNGRDLEYKIWNLDIDDSIHRIETEWNELGRVPSIGEIAWLITSDKGEEEARRILSERNNDNLDC